MLTKFFKWFLGERAASSFGGIAAGAALGAGAALANGQTDKEALIIGAAGGAISAVAGASGRMSGERKK